MGEARQIEPRNGRPGSWPPLANAGARPYAAAPTISSSLIMVPKDSSVPVCWLHVTSAPSFATCGGTTAQYDIISSTKEGNLTSLRPNPTRMRQVASTGPVQYQGGDTGTLNGLIIGPGPRRQVNQTLAPRRLAQNTVGLKRAAVTQVYLNVALIYVTRLST
jgi:hypothetical protein